LLASHPVDMTTCTIIHLCFRSNEKKELETKQRVAVAADPLMTASAAAASVGATAASSGQSELHELKKRNDELEDEVRILASFSFERPHGILCHIALVLHSTCSLKNVEKVK